MLERITLISRIPKNKFWVTDWGQVEKLVGEHSQNIHLIVNPAIETHLSTMTDQRTDLDPYRHAARCAGDTLLSEVSHQFPTQRRAVRTPWGSVPGVKFTSHPLFISVLRGARPLESCIEKYFPYAPIVPITASRNIDDPWHACITTSHPKLPPPDNWNIVIDDMTFATGATFFATGDLLKEKELISRDSAQVTNLSLVSVFTSVPGLERAFNDFPNLQVYTSRIIFKLDSKCYMIGGPGDAGLRCSYDIATIKRMHLH